MQGAPECAPLIRTPGTRGSDVVPMVPEPVDLGPRAAPQLHTPALLPGSVGRTVLCPGVHTFSSVCVSIGGPFEVLVGPPQPLQPVRRVPRLGGGEAPACRASQPGAGLRGAPRPSVSPHPGLCSDGALAGCTPRAAPAPALLCSPRAPPGCLDPWSSPPAQRAPSVRRDADRLRTR